MTDDPAHDYDVWCRDHAEPEDCDACSGTGSVPAPGCLDDGDHEEPCGDCNGTGFEHVAARKRAAEQYAADMSAAAEVLAPLFDDFVATDEEIAEHKCGCEFCSHSAVLCTATKSSIVMARMGSGFESDEDEPASPPASSGAGR